MNGVLEQPNGVSDPGRSPGFGSEGASHLGLPILGLLGREPGSCVFADAFTALVHLDSTCQTTTLPRNRQRTTIMTSLIAWIGVDQRGIASTYFASDSRITWPQGGSWDHGRKLFVARQYPHVLGYSGDVLFPTQTLSQIVEMIDLGMLVDAEGDVGSCLERIIDVLSRSLDSYPRSALQSFQVLYGTREGVGLRSRFHLRLVSFDGGREARTEVIRLPAKSGAVALLGSGAASFRSHLRRWESSEVGGTSRAVFSAFSDALRQGTDPATGGPPQLIGLYRRGGGRTFGVLWHGRRYFYGTEVQSLSSMETVKWHNALFEICDPLTLDRKPGAQPQPRPRSVREDPS